MMASQFVGAVKTLSHPISGNMFVNKCNGNSPTKQRLLVVSNSLPVSAKRQGEDLWTLEMGADGQFSSFMGVEKYEARWIGWAGVNVPDKAGKKALTAALAENKCIPVFLDEDIANHYYNGYCNRILWPLLHYLRLPREDRPATTWSYESQFAAYQKANRMFADVIINHYEEGDVVWCHDFHLMLLPKYLKEYNRNIKVGWFLHTPFPSPEIYRTLPSGSELLSAVLMADLVRFPTYDISKLFVSACTSILGVEGTPEAVKNQGRVTRVAVFPIGIDSERFTRAIELPEVQKLIKEFKEKFSGKKVILGVERLDIIIGIPEKIQAFEKFLEENEYWRDKIVLLQIGVPSRTDASKYETLKSRVHEYVGRVNGRFGSSSDVPIHYLDHSIDFYAMCALYAITDVALVTSMRDRMYLAISEFVACQVSKRGVLILSEYAGAIHSLGPGSLPVDPYNFSQVAAEIGKALNMSTKERDERHRHNFEYVKTHTAEKWADFFKRLSDDDEGQC